MIDAKSQEIKPASDDTFSDMLDLADELPDSSPRFVLLSYPLTLVHHNPLTVRLRSWLWWMGANGLVLAVRKNVSPIRAAVLSAGELQSELEDDICGRGGVDAQYGGGQSRY